MKHVLDKKLKRLSAKKQESGVAILNFCVTKGGSFNLVRILEAMALICVRFN
jgi:hypothetical protein